MMDAGGPVDPNNPPLPLALTMGEPAGIAPEISLKTWRDARADVPPFFLVADAEAIQSVNDALGLTVPIAVIDDPAAAREIFPGALPVLRHVLPAPAVPGRLDVRNAPAVVQAIERAVALVQDGSASAVVTNPIHKATLTASGFGFSGHTDFLADLAGSDVTPVMMLASPRLRVIPVTIHIALKDVPARLDKEILVQSGRIADEAMRRDFAIEKPRLAFTGLNPHAGEDGTLGREEIDTIVPAITALRDSGIDARGPFAADTMFHAAARETYDIALCMYHDQALVPLKTLDFEAGVNVTLGLPFVRTSPDHGTALDIAGGGTASPESLIAALRLAGEMARSRAKADATARPRTIAF